MRIRSAVLAAVVGVLALAGVLHGAAGPPSIRPLEPRPAGVRAEAEVRKDVPYASASPVQTLHLSLPHRYGVAVPLVVVVHGGGWFEGDKGDVLGIVQSLNAAGYATAAVGYRLSGEAPFPAAVVDVATAVRWVRAHASTYGVDASRIALMGLSAGGHLASMVAVTGGETDVLGDDAAPFASGVADDVARRSAAVQAVVSWYGPSDFAAMDAQAAVSACRGEPDVHGGADSPESRWLGVPVATHPERAAAAAPATYLDGAGDLPPFHLAHGDRDCTVPRAQSDGLAAALRDAGASVSLTVLPDGEHATDAFTEEQIGPSIDFLDGVLGAAP
ncbi:alpha/beta hydrolase [Actinomycetospora flava]|uniref:Alpha/beta hydrolase n=1 Tax=Actinomycetospora flava TaxID=3129232 RepID=A0ABU8MBK7_9PSEU